MLVYPSVCHTVRLFVSRPRHIIFGSGFFPKWFCLMISIRNFTVLSANSTGSTTFYHLRQRLVKISVAASYSNECNEYFPVLFLGERVQNEYGIEMIMLNYRDKSFDTLNCTTKFLQVAFLKLLGIDFNVLYI